MGVEDKIVALRAWAAAKVAGRHKPAVQMSVIHQAANLPHLSQLLGLTVMGRPADRARLRHTSDKCEPPDRSPCQSWSRCTRPC